jgi:hypothetical protein
MAAPQGNQNAVKGKRWQKALEKALARIGEGDVDIGLSKVADKVVSAAAQGDKEAWKEIGDRMDGRATQSIDANVTGNLVGVLSGLSVGSKDHT